MSQQPFTPGQPSGRPSDYRPPGQPQGYQPGYQQAGPPGYGGYQQPPPRDNPFTTSSALAPILTIVGYVLSILGVIAFILALVIGSEDLGGGASVFPGAYRFFLAVMGLIVGLGLGALCLFAGAFLRRRPA